MKLSNGLRCCIAAFVVTVAATSARAGSISYTTSGYFGAFPGSASLEFGGPPADPGNSILTFAGTSQTYTDPINIFDVVLGTFTLTSGDSTPDTLSPTAFTLDIVQSFPNSNSGTFLGSVSGTVVLSGGVLTVTGWVPATDNLGGVLYTPDTFTLVAGSAGTTSKDLEGMAVAPPGTPVVPLPLPAVAGLGLFGLIGAKQLSRKRRLA